MAATVSVLHPGVHWARRPIDPAIRQCIERAIRFRANRRNGSDQLTALETLEKRALGRAFSFRLLFELHRALAGAVVLTDSTYSKKPRLFNVLCTGISRTESLFFARSMGIRITHTPDD